MRDSGSGAALRSLLELPPAARACAVFVHGSGSNMHSPRNRAVAQSLRQVGIGTLLVDLLTDAENERDQYTREFRFDVPRLARRVADCVDALKSFPTTKHLPVMLVGSSTGAAAALMAAAKRADRVAAVVSRGGRADLAGDALGQVRAPTLLIVGGDDHQVLQLNRDAAAQMKAAQSVRLTVVPGASHLFEEPGKMDQVTAITAEFLDQHSGAAAKGQEAAGQGEVEQPLREARGKAEGAEEMKQPESAAEAAAASRQSTPTD